MVQGRGLYELLSRRLEDSVHERFVVQKRSGRVHKCFNSISRNYLKNKILFSNFNSVVKGVAEDVYQYSASFLIGLNCSSHLDITKEYILTLQHTLYCSQYSANLLK